MGRTVIPGVGSVDKMPVLLVVDLTNGDTLAVILIGPKYQVRIGCIHLTHGSLKPLRPLCLPHKGQAGPLQVGHLQ